MVNRTLAVVLALLLGSLGIHKFYLGQYGLGFLYFLFSFTGIPFILSVIDIVVLVCMSDIQFDMRYNSRIY